MDNEPSWLKEQDENPFSDNSVVAAETAAPVNTSTKPNDPSWLTEGSSAEATPKPGNSISDASRNQATAIGTQIATDVARDAANAQAENIKLTLREMPRPWLAMRFFNFALTIPLFFIAWEKAFDGSSTSIDDLGDNSSVLILALYIFIFSIMMCSFETCGTNKTCGSSVAMYFGFMYTITGRVVFMILVGLLCLSLNSLGSIIVAVLIFANALYNLAVMMYYPNWREQTYKQQSMFLDDIEEG